MKIKIAYLEKVIKEELQRTMEGQRRRRFAQPKVAPPPVVAQPKVAPPPAAVAEGDDPDLTKPAVAGVQRRSSTVKAPMPQVAKAAPLVGTNPAIADKVSQVVAGQHPVQRGEYDLKGLKVPAGNVPVFSANGTQMGSFPVGKAPPHLIPRLDAQRNIIGYDAPK